MRSRVCRAPLQRSVLRLVVRREQLARGRGDQLPGRTFSAPRKWMKGKGRITIQYGVCYSYANPPGITDDVTEAMPKTLNGAPSCCAHPQMNKPSLSAAAAVIDRMVRWGVLPATVRPDSVRPLRVRRSSGRSDERRPARSASSTSTRRLTVRFV